MLAIALAMPARRAAGEAAAGWTPAELFGASEAGVWYDPSDLSTMFQNSNGTTAAVVDSPVGYIADKSGNGKHATQSTSGSRPILRLSSGKYYLEFDGSDDYLAIGSPPAVRTVCAGTMLSSTSSAFFEPLLSEDGADTSNTLRRDGGGDLYRRDYHSVDANRVNGAVTLNITTDAAHVITTWRAVADGGGVAFGAICGNTGPSRYWKGRLYGLVLHEDVIADLSDLEAYVAAKSGVTL